MRRPPLRKSAFQIVDRTEEVDIAPVAAPVNHAFRVLIAVHRPRYRGRAQRAADLVGWEVTSLLNKQDPVGQVCRPPRPPDLLVISGDFGRQKSYGIIRAVQEWRKEGMRIIGMVEDCEAAPEGYPEAAAEQLCDVCITPPYTAKGLRELFSELYEEMRGRPAPPPRSTTTEPADDLDEEDEE